MQITIREPGSAITHFIAMMMAVFATVPLLVKAGIQSGWENFLAMAIFMGSMILLYGASATYHSVDLTGRSLRVFRKLDHMMIFVLIAGSYTPVCLIVLGGKLGYTLLALVWGIAAVGMLVKACWITCPKWFSSVIYIAMGWVCVLVFGPLLKTLSVPAFLWLLAGGIIYTVPVTAIHIHLIHVCSTFRIGRIIYFTICNPCSGSIGSKLLFCYPCFTMVCFRFQMG